MAMLTPAATAPRSRRTMRFLHRWGGLLFGGWFLLVGISGSLLVWNAELDAALNPQWFDPLPSCGERERPIEAVLATFNAARPAARAAMVVAPDQADAAHIVWEAAGAEGYRRQHFIDAGCGVHLGERRWGALQFDRAHAVPALYEFHRSLLSGAAGHIAAGALGLVLLAVVTTAVPLAWPRRGQRGGWRRALTVQTRGPAMRFCFDLHRAGGLWLAGVLVLLAATGAYLCFPAQGRMLVGAVLPTGHVAPPPDSVAPATDPDSLARHAETLLGDARWTRLQLPAAPSTGYRVRLLQADEPRKDTGSTQVAYDAAGRVTELRDPLQSTAGETVLAWLFPLHSGEALGIAGRWAWTAFGLSPAVLFLTGGWLWLRKRHRRRMPKQLWVATPGGAAAAVMQRR